MHYIDFTIMKLERTNCSIKDFFQLLKACELKNYDIDRYEVNGNLFYAPERDFFCDMTKFPLIHRDPFATCSPVICCASGNNYFITKVVGEDFVMDQHTSITSILIGLGEYFKDVRILDAKFNDKSSIYLVMFNGNTDN